MRKGKLFIISGPSGVGKGSICRELLKKRDMELSISMTTREPRTGEENGIHYYFVTHNEFEEMISRNGFLEYAGIYENYYGTPKEKVLEKLAEGKDVLLEIEMQGAIQAKKAYPQAVLIFILPPSLEDLRKRLEKRGTESEEKISMRLSTAISEMEYLSEYEYSIVNDVIADAIERIEHIIEAEHLKVSGKAEEIIEKYKEEIQP